MMKRSYFSQKKHYLEFKLAVLVLIFHIVFLCLYYLKPIFSTSECCWRLNMLTWNTRFRLISSLSDRSDLSKQELHNLQMFGKHMKGIGRNIQRQTTFHEGKLPVMVKLAYRY